VSGFNHLPAIISAMGRDLANAVKAGTVMLEGEIKQSMGDEKHGLLYPRRGGKAHQASGPGEAPAIDTGALVNDFSIRKMGDYEWQISTHQEQAAALEFGRLDGTIQARPFMRPAARKKKAEYMQMLQAALNRAAQAGGG